MFGFLSQMLAVFVSLTPFGVCHIGSQEQTVGAEIIHAAKSQLAQESPKPDPLQSKITSLIKKLAVFGGGEESEIAVKELLKIHKANPQAIAGPQINSQIREMRAAKIGMTLGNSHLGDAALSREADRGYNFGGRYKDAIELANTIEDQSGVKVWDYAFREAVAGNTRPHAIHVIELVKAAKGRGLDEVRRTMDRYIEKAQDPKISTENFFMQHGQTNFEIYHEMFHEYGALEDVERLRRYAKVHEVRKHRQQADQAYLDALFVEHRLWARQTGFHLGTKNEEKAVAQLREFRDAIKQGKYEPFEREERRLDPEGLFLDSLMSVQSALGFTAVDEFEVDVLDSFKNSDNHVNLKIEFLATQEVLKRKAGVSGNSRAINLLDEFDKGEIEIERDSLDWGKQAQKKVQELKALRNIQIQ